MASDGLLLTKVVEPVERECYARQAVRGGWTRSTLESSIKNRLYQRQEAAITSFADRLVAEYALFGIDKPMGVAEYRQPRLCRSRWIPACRRSRKSRRPCHGI